MIMTRETDALKPENADLIAILQEMCTTVREAAHNGTAIHEVERAVWQQILKMGHTLLGEFLGLLGQGDMGESLTLPDGRVGQRLDDLHSRRYVSIFGVFQLERVAYGSREGQKINFVPLDNRLQLPEGAFSYLLQDWDQGFCVEAAFGQAGRTIERMLGLKQSVDTLERMNAQMAELVDDYRAERVLPKAAEEGEILVSSADGKGVVMRRQEGEQAPPTHRTKGDKASHKQTMANLASTDAEGTHSGIEKTYQWLLEEIWARNHGFQKEMAHLCDGQETLWEARQRHLPQRNMTDILDLLHVTPRLWQAAHVFYREKSQEAEQFIRERLLKVLKGDVELVIRGLREMATKRHLTGPKKATLAKICAYFQNNRQRMRYDEYLAKGYPIASGVIEGACRHLVKDRMERAGMHWTRAGAQAMLDVRSIHINGDWEQYQTFRIERETTRQYPWREAVAGENYTLAA